MKAVLEVVLVVDSWRGPGAVLLSPEADLALTDRKSTPLNSNH